MQHRPINLEEKFRLFHEQWQPKVIAEMNEYQFKVVRLEGDFVWHSHEDTDEAFIVLDGVLRVDFRDGAVNLGAGEMYVVGRGVEHKPFAEHEVKAHAHRAARGTEYRRSRRVQNRTERRLDLTGGRRHRAMDEFTA